jgi:secreted PhoX family phosphatase
MANLKNTTDPDRELTEVHNLMSRRETLAGAAKLVAGLSIGAQVMAATGADTALAQHVRDVAGRADKPGYGPLTNHTGEMSLPEGFHYVHFGDAYTPMSDGFLTPPCHDGTTVFRAGKGVVRMIRNHEGYGQGKTRGGKFNAYDRVARGGVTSSLFDTDKGELLESGIVLNGTHENCNGGATPWGSWLSCEENTEGPTQGFEKPHGYVFEVPSKANRAVEPVPIKAMGRMEHEAAAIDPRSGIVYLTEDNGDPADGFYRFLPDDTRRLRRAPPSSWASRAATGRRARSTSSPPKAVTKMRARSGATRPAARSTAR